MHYKEVVTNKAITLGEPDLVFVMSDSYKHEKRNLSGVYVFKDGVTEEIYYVGVTGDFHKRLSQHVSKGVKDSSLRHFLFELHEEEDATEEILKETVVSFWEEENFFYQDFLEKYLICTLDPLFNSSRRTRRIDERYCGTSLQDKIKAVALLGR